MELRPAVPGDELGVATVNVAAWREGYRGLLPAADLAAMRAEDRAANYTFGAEAEVTTQVVVDDAGVIVGFVTTGAARDDDASGLGEVCAMYVDPGHWRSGLGSVLMDAAHRQLTHQGFRAAVLWFLTGNDRAERFYRHHGWAPDGTERTATVWGITAAERRMRRDLYA
jgi:GNAT superfamily N-acetyltransferase